MSNHVEAFLMAMADAGLAMHKPGVEADGNLHRFRVADDKAGSRNGWYVFHDDAKPFGAFGSWKTGQSGTFTAAKPEAMTPAERRELQARLAAAKAARDAEQAKVYAEAAARAATLWAKAGPASNEHPYLVRKRVPAYGLRLLRERLVIPLRDCHGNLHSLQFIGPDGKKTFLTGGRKRGCYHAMGRPAAALCIAEGYATAATIHKATGYAVACAFDAGNLIQVAKAIRGKFPRLVLVICADDDRETPGNPGLTKAKEAAQAVDAVLAVPRFTEVCHV